MQHVVLGQQTSPCVPRCCQQENITADPIAIAHQYLHTILILIVVRTYVRVCARDTVCPRRSCGLAKKAARGKAAYNLVRYDLS